VNSLLFIGDIILNNNFNNEWEKGNNPFINITHLTAENFVIGNLEAIASNNNNKNNLVKKTILSTNINTLNFVKYFNLNLASLANNHIYDNLDEGINKTIEFLSKNKINFFGISANNNDDIYYYKYDIILNNNPVCILTYLTPDTNPNIPSNTNIKVSLYKKEIIINNIKYFKNKYKYIILYIHWGGRVEGAMLPDKYQFHDAHAFIDAGADMIIGHHSHTLQPFEIYKNKYIFYSIGNFCSDSIYKKGIRHKRRTQGIMIKVSIKNDNLIPEIIPIRQINMSIVIDYGILKKYYRRSNIFKFIMKIPFLWYLYFFKIKFLEPIYFYFFENNKGIFKQLSSINIYKIRTFFYRIVN